MNENEIGTIIVGTAINIHKKIGPGLLESVYEIVLCRTLEQQGLKVQRQVNIPIVIDDVKYDEGFRADIIVNDKVIIEVKSIAKVMDLHKKQLLTYLRLSNLNLGYVINFNEELLKDGLTRIVNGYF
jgi:GxxExxY protein